MKDILDRIETPYGLSTCWRECLIIAWEEIGIKYIRDFLTTFYFINDKLHQAGYKMIEDKLMQSIINNIANVYTIWNLAQPIVEVGSDEDEIGFGIEDELDSGDSSSEECISDEDSGIIIPTNMITRAVRELNDIRDQGIWSNRQKYNEDVVFANYSELIDFYTADVKALIEKNARQDEKWKEKSSWK